MYSLNPNFGFLIYTSGLIVSFHGFYYLRLRSSKTSADHDE